MGGASRMRCVGAGLVAALACATLTPISSFSTSSLGGMGTRQLARVQSARPGRMAVPRMGLFDGFGGDIFGGEKTDDTNPLLSRDYRPPARQDGTWEEYSDESGNKYYFNTATQETLWEAEFAQRTAELQAQEAAKRAPAQAARVPAAAAPAARGGGGGGGGFRFPGFGGGGGGGGGTTTLGATGGMDATKFKVAWRQGGGTMMQKGGFGYVFFGTYDATPNPNAKPVLVEVCIKLPNEDPDSVTAHKGETEINRKVAQDGGIPGVADFIGTVDLNPIAAQLPPGIGSTQGIVWRVIKGKTLDNFFDTAGGMSPVVANTLNIRSEPPTKIKGGVTYIKTQLCEKVMGETLLPLAQLHERGIIHRDLKPRNIMLSQQTPTNPLVIIDFGSAVEKGKRPFMNDYTEVYAPPEAPLPDGGNPFSYDIFTVGIVGLRVLMPSLIAGENGIATLGRVCVSEIPSYNYDLRAWATARATDPGGQFVDPQLNKECEGLLQQPVLLDLISRMLSPNVRERPSAEECLNMLGPSWQARLAQSKQGQQSRGNCGTCGEPVLSTDAGRYRDARGVYYHQNC